MVERRNAVLAVSFGTCHEETRKKTIDRIEDDLRSAYPDFVVYRAWTSGMVIRKLKMRDAVAIDTVEEALERMKRDGVKRLVVQPTHILNGIENDIMMQKVQSRAGMFESVTFGEPLLSSTEDCFEAAGAVMKEFPDLEDDEALVLMGHGTSHYSNCVYAALDYIFRDIGHENVFVGTVEGYPAFENIERLLRKSGFKRVRLAPFMVVAGEHAQCDLAGDDENSWKRRLESGGCEVRCTLRGLGEYEGIRRIYLKHAKKAMQG